MSLTIVLGAVAAVTGAACAGMALLIARNRRELQTVRRHLETLSKLEPADLIRDPKLDRIPPLRVGSFWEEVSRHVREAIERHALWGQEQIHARRALELRLARSAADLERLKIVFRSLADPVIALDQYNEVVLANPSAGELFGFEPESPADRAMARLLHCEKLVQLLLATSQRETPGTRTEDLEIAGRDGQARWYRVTATKLGAEGESGDAAAGGTLAVLRDVGDQKVLQKRNAEFVSAVSHEMKTPLAGIKAYVELLADGDAEDEKTQEEFLEVINSQTDRLQRLVDNMLNLARIEAGVTNVNKQPRSLNELLDEALHVVQPSAEAKNLQLQSDLSPLYLGVMADRDMLLQAAINLLSNAIKYTPQGGRIALRSRLVDDHVRFEVADTGVGLSPEDAKRVFEKFYRVGKDKHMASGTGLGLPLAKHIVEDVHGGRLTVESKLGEGSTFIAELPSAGRMT